MRGIVKYKKSIFKQVEVFKHSLEFMLTMPEIQ